MLKLNTLIYTTLVVETVLRFLEHAGFWSGTVPNETVLFMICSALLMFLMSKRKSETFTHFWYLTFDFVALIVKTLKFYRFYTPPKTNFKEDVCCHQEDSCQKHCLNVLIYSKVSRKATLSHFNYDRNLYSSRKHSI